MSEHTAESELNTHEWDNPEGVKKIANFLRGRKGIAVRHAVELGKRVEYVKGSTLIKFLMEKSKNSKYCPEITTQSDAIQVGRWLVSHGYIHRSERDASNRKLLTPCRNHSFESDGYYTWMYDGPKTLRNVLTALLIIGALAVTCYPIWPYNAKIVVWYMSVTMLIFTVVFTIIRFFLFLFSWMIGMEFWFLPNVFDDNLGVVESFQPLYTLRRTEASEQIWRIIAVILFGAFCVWIYNQPTDFDEYMEITRQFTDDIYSGKLLDEMSQKSKEDIDKIRVPDLESLMAEEEEGPEDVDHKMDEKLREDDTKDDAEQLMDEILEQDAKDEL